MRKVLITFGVAAMAFGGFTACHPVTECGTVLTHDTTLGSDIVGCAGDGLIVGADGITVDLNGHTVRSDGGVGIRVAGHDGVTIKAGTVSGLSAGLAISDAQHVSVVRVLAESPNLTRRG